MQRIPTLLTFGLVAGASFGAACWNRADGHCGNLNGDFTCEERGTGLFCDICVSTNDGCTTQPPSPMCHYEGLTEETSTSRADASSPNEEPLPTTDDGDTTIEVTTGGDEPPYPQCIPDNTCPAPYTMCYQHFEDSSQTFCTHECRYQSDCQQPITGNAPAVCTYFLEPSQCVIDCRDERACPDNMSCKSVRVDMHILWRCAW
jgi:hypothetical protein